MGCTTSKLDDSPAVELCRHRCNFLDEAIRHRFAFAEAHAAYLSSLKTVGLSLHRFFNLQDLDPSVFRPPSPVLNLPPSRKGDPQSPEKARRSSSSSHIQFQTDSESDDDVTSPVDYVRYMKNQTTPSVVRTEMPVNAETMYVGESLSSSYYPYQISNGYSSYGDGGGIFGGPSKPTSPPVEAAISKAPPLPPSPPSTWDFLNPFESSEPYYPTYSSSHGSREMREEEGMPELEDDDDEVVVKDVRGGRDSYSTAAPPQEEAPAKNAVDSKHKVYKNAVESSQNRGGFKNDLEVLKEIQVQFDHASESGNDLSNFLEVGKLPHKQKHTTNHVSSKILRLTAVSFNSSTSKASDNADPAFLDIHQDVELKSKNLSSVLHKLYLWEKKLYEEVKDEEKMRVDHERKSQKLKHMDRRGSEADKVDATRSMVRSLSTKIKIAIQVVDKISMKISRLRDEELWPQLNEFIKGLTRMWKSMLECHHNQLQAMAEAKQLDAIARNHSAEDHFEATRQLQHDLINWILWFSHWVTSLKSYVLTLNNWLTKCLLYTPEETPDGIAPFSPGRMGAPTVFIICNQWSQSLHSISEKEVVDSMLELASNVIQLWDRDKAEMRKRMLANKDERKLKSLEKEDQKIQREIMLLEKKMMFVPTSDNETSRVVYPSETTKGGSLQVSLQHVLEAMEKFMSNSLKIYEDLLQRMEDDEQERVA